MVQSSTCETGYRHVTAVLPAEHGTDFSNWMRCTAAIAAVLALSGCAGPNESATDPLREPRGHARDAAPNAQGETSESTTAAIQAGRPLGASLRGNGVSEVYPGDDRFVRESVSDVSGSGEEAKFTLSFDDAELNDIVHAILGETLEVPYLLDSRIDGRATLHTSGPVSARALLEILETVLRMHGGALVFQGESYRIIPATEALRSSLIPQVGGLARTPSSGYQVRIVPLRYVPVGQMREILEPLAPPGGVVRTDAQRNLLTLAGTGPEIEAMLETVEMFDVDWLQGMSIGLFVIEQVSAQELANELRQVMGLSEGGPLAGIVRLVVVERLNAILCISSRAHYLEAVRRWTERLDKGTQTGRNLYVYRLENGKAEEIARILSEIFDDPGARRGAAPGGVGPGYDEVRAQSSGDEPAVELAEGRSPLQLRAVLAEPVALGARAEIRIIADEINNALVVLANAQDYRMVEAAIRKLDVVPLQVLVEATIVEVTLNDALRYGVQWFLRAGGGGSIRFGSPESASTQGVRDALSFIVTNRAGATRLALEALESVTNVQVVSSPHLMIQDNQTAELQIGDQVPVVTQQQQSTTGDANVVNSVEFRDTGVILRVTPRVNAGGSVSMDIEQEFSEAVPNTANALTPTISQRMLKSTVVVQSGETVILGGLIETSDSTRKSGVPVLSRLPVLGVLLSSNEDSGQRTEIIVLISPTVVRNQDEARRVTEEMRRRLGELPESAGLPLRGRDDPRPATPVQ